MKSMILNKLVNAIKSLTGFGAAKNRVKDLRNDVKRATNKAKNAVDNLDSTIKKETSSQTWEDRLTK